MVTVDQRVEPRERPRIDRPGAGGCVLNTGVHGFDLFRFLTGAEAVSVQAETGCAVTRLTDDQFAAVIRLEPGGILGSIDNARTTLGRSGSISLVGEKARLRAEHIHRSLQRIEGRSARELGPVPAAPTVVAALRAFVRSLRDGTPPPVSALDGLEGLDSSA